MKKIPLYLVTGFLGSGKTTLIKRLIDGYSGRMKLAVIQNEFAPGNFDGQELKRTTHGDFDLLEVNNGSVFCLCLLGGFVKSLSRFISEYQPDMLFLEASGLSDPVSVGQVFGSEYLKDQIFLAGSICVVDGSNYLKINQTMQRINHQIMIADMVLINKTDKINDAGSVRKKISQLNPYAEVVETHYANVTPEKIFGLNIPACSNKTSLFLPLGGPRPDIDAWVIRSTKKLIAPNLSPFLKLLASVTLRAKGVIRVNNNTVVTMQSVLDESAFEEIESNVAATELIVMGKNLNEKEVLMLYESFCSE